MAEVVAGEDVGGATVVGARMLLEMRHQAQRGLMRRMPTTAMDRHGLVGVVVPHLTKVAQEGAEWHRVRAMALALIEEAQGE